jgi:hypothetical protein
MLEDAIGIRDIHVSRAGPRSRRRTVVAGEADSNEVRAAPAVPPRISQLATIVQKTSREVYTSYNNVIELSPINFVVGYLWVYSLTKVKGPHRDAVCLTVG